MTKFSELRKSFEGAVSTGLMTTDEVNEKLAKAFAAGTAENDEVVAEPEPIDDATVLTKAIDAAADEWMAKAETKSDDDGDEGVDYESSDEDEDESGDDDDHSEGEPEDKGAEAEAACDDKDMSKGFGLSPEDAAAILAKAVGAEVATQNESLHVVLRKALGKISQLEDRLEKVGNMAYAMSVNSKLAKAQTAPVPAPVTAIDPDVTVRLDRIEKATTERLERIEKAIKAPAGTFRGITNIADYEAAPAPGDENDPTRPMAKGFAYVSEKLLEMQKAARANHDNTLETQINKDIGQLSIFPFQADQYAAKYGIQ